MIYGLNDSDKIDWTSTYNTLVLNPWHLILCIAFILIFFEIIILFLMNSQQMKNMKNMIENSQTKFLNTYTKESRIQKRQHFTDLSNFKPLTTYKAYDINQKTSNKTLDMLINEAKQTARFSYSTYYHDESNKKYLVIDFIQSSSSIIINIDIFEESNIVFDKIQELLTIIFCSSNTIYTWNYLSIPPMEFGIYDIIYSNSNEINQRNFVTLQHQFKYWYNKTFNHDENCDQIVDFINTDGPLCSCLYRPYKSQTDTWTLSMAIMYTFYENLQLIDHPLNQCLAITKLAIVIEQGVHHRQIKTFMRASSRMK